MKSLSFVDETADWNGRRVRRSHFVERSLLPSSAACMVAGGVRETLAMLLGSGVEVHVTEPILPSPRAWQAITQGARIYRVGGRLADVALVLRESDALALAGAAFGEQVQDARPLSEMERGVLERILTILAGQLVVLCGASEQAPRLDLVNDIAGFTTFFELIVRGASSCRIAICLSRDPPARGAASLALEDLGEVQIELAARLQLAAISPQAVLDLVPGAFLPMKNKTAPFDAEVCMAGWPLACGEGGVSGVRFALVLDGRRPATIRSGE